MKLTQSEISPARLFDFTKSKFYSYLAGSKYLTGTIRFFGIRPRVGDYVKIYTTLDALPTYFTIFRVSGALWFWTAEMKWMNPFNDRLDWYSAFGDALYED